MKIRLAFCLVFSALFEICGCAPRSLEQALTYYVDQEHVRDAAARRTNAAWYLRFDAALLRDLEEAMEDGVQDAKRERANQALRAAGELALHATHAEIERLSPDAKIELAHRVAVTAKPDEIAKLVEIRQKNAIESELDGDQRLDQAAWLRRMRQIRAGVEPLPDERDRLARRMFLGAFAPAVIIGVEKQENEIRNAARNRSHEPVERAEVWDASTNATDPRARWAPVIAVESPPARDYPADDDRIGSVALSGSHDQINVSIDPRRPSLYCYESSAVVHGKRCKQLAYVWWFPERPSMIQDDAVAGHIDGGTLRLTLDHTGSPAIAEIVLNCGCGHEVYVAESLEAVARSQFGPPLPDAQYAIEKRTAGRRPVLVAGVFASPRDDERPIVVLEAGTHEPRRFACGAIRSAVRTSVETHPLALEDYDVLDRLPLGDGLASMFGPDGLVHNAGRKEGYLLAPTGMMSAGQPRKRGTQRVRWDDYVFDDPEFLVQTLRIPNGF